MRRIVRGKPLLFVTAAATATLMAGCSPVSGNLAAPDTGPAPDAGQPDTSIVSGNLSVLTPDAGVDAATAPPDTGTDGGH